MFTCLGLATLPTAITSMPVTLTSKAALGLPTGRRGRLRKKEPGWGWSGERREDPRNQVRDFTASSRKSNTSILGPEGQIWKIISPFWDTSRGVGHNRVGHKTHAASWTHQQFKSFHYSPKTPLPSSRELLSEQFPPNALKAKETRSGRVETGSSCGERRASRYSPNVIRSAPMGARWDWLRGGRCRPTPLDSCAGFCASSVGSWAVWTSASRG